MAALLGAVLGWAANHFLPGLWRQLTRRPPLHVFVETNPALIWAGSPPWVSTSYVVPDPRNLGAPPSNFCPDWHDWLRDAGAVPGPSTEAEITLTASGDLTVVVDGFRTRIVRQGDLPPWTHLQCLAGGADIIPRHVRIDLEAFSPPTASFVDSGGSPIAAPKLSLSKGEAEKIYLIAEARYTDVEWTGELLVIVDGKRRVLTIDDNGKPFRTCGTEGLRTHRWVGTEWEPPLPG